jgi:tetratricopeptide (TPR) repeat protein
MAVALVALRRYAEAATKLDTLAHGGFATDPSMRMDLFDQAGNAWLLANKADGAIASFTAALAIDPADADLLADRARANAMKKNWARAESDLSAALLVNPNRADLLVLRGSARHAQGRKADARADFERALKLHPGFADALVERGTMKYQAGDVAGARADWTIVVSTSPNSATSAVARQHLADTEPAQASSTDAPPRPVNGSSVALEALSRTSLAPLRANVGIVLLHRAMSVWIAGAQLSQRPDRHRAHERRRIV